MQNLILIKRTTMAKLVEQHWDYTKHAKFYEFRPNYASATLDMLVALIHANTKQTMGGGEHPRLYMKIL